jgi:hypothetical protein
MALKSRFFILAAAIGGLLAGAQAQSSGATLVQDLLGSLGRFDQEGRPANQKVAFELPEKAVNDYLAYALRTRPRPGISSITVKLLPGNQISADVEIDFSAISADALPEAMRSMLSGKRMIHAEAKFDAQGGFCNFSLKDAQGPDGKAIVNKVMAAVLQSLGSQQPESYDTAKPIPLPFGLKRIWTDKQLLCGET